MIKLWSFNPDKKLLYYIVQSLYLTCIGVPTTLYYWSLWDSNSFNLHVSLLVFTLHCSLNVMLGLNLFRCIVLPRDSFELEIQRWFMEFYGIPASFILLILHHNFYLLVHVIVLCVFQSLLIRFCFKKDS